ncbi:hypothetical protein GCM10009837_04790 [Streptomyces durmitorensis]
MLWLTAAMWLRHGLRGSSSGCCLSGEGRYRRGLCVPAGRWGLSAQFPAPLTGRREPGDSKQSARRGAGNCAASPHRPAESL